MRRGGLVLGQVRGDDRPWLPETVEDPEPSGPTPDRDSLYVGIAGLALVLAEIRAYRPLTTVEDALAAAIVARFSAVAAVRVEAALFDGLAGDAVTLRLLAAGREHPALRRLAEPATPADQWWAVPGPLRTTGADQ